MLSSFGTASRTGTVSSKPASDLPDLDRDLPTTVEDVRVLRRLRRPRLENLLPRINELAPPDLFGPPERLRRTFAGAEPFTL